MKHDELFKQRTKIITDLKDSYANKQKIPLIKQAVKDKRPLKRVISEFNKKKKYPYDRKSTGFNRAAYSSFWG